MPASAHHRLSLMAKCEHKETHTPSIAHRGSFRSVHEFMSRLDGHTIDVERESETTYHRRRHCPPPPPPWSPLALAPPPPPWT